MAKTPRIPWNAPTLDPEIYQPVSDVSNIPDAYFIEQEFTPDQTCQYCEQANAHDPAQQERVAIGIVNNLRCCQYHLALFELEPETARLA